MGLQRHRPSWSGCCRVGDVIERLTLIAPEVADLLKGAEEDLAACFVFPIGAPGRAGCSTRPLERVKREIGRCADVVGIFRTTRRAAPDSAPAERATLNEWVNRRSRPPTSPCA